MFNNRTCPINSIFSFIKNKGWHWYAALAITLIAGFLRLYNIPDNVMFLGDQGRDALVVARIFKQKDPVFIGPVTSVGNMYLGPFYYYFMLPFLWLSYPSPLGPVYAVAVLNTAAVYLIYVIGKKMFSPAAGLLAAFFLAFSASAIDISRFSWNPNLASLVSLLMIFFTWKALKNSKFWLLVSLCFSILIQLHYLTLLSGVSAGLIWLYSLITKIKSKETAAVRRLLKQSLLCFVILILSFTPLILFDIKHQGVNLKAFQQIIFKEETFAAAETSGLLPRISEIIIEAEARARNILVKLNLGSRKTLNRGLLALISASLLGLLSKAFKNNKHKNALIVLISYLLIGILGTAAYQHSIYNHYIAYLFPVTALIYGLLAAKAFKTKWLALLPLAFIGLFLHYNLNHLPLESNYLYKNTQAAAFQIYEKLNKNETYDIVLLSETRDLYGQSYRYFLSTTDKPPIYKDRETTQLPETLIIIDEEKKFDDVTALPIYEIVIHAAKEVDQKITNENLPDIYILRKKQT